MIEEARLGLSLFSFEAGDDGELAEGVVFPAEFAVGLGEVEMGLNEIGAEPGGLFERGGGGGEFVRGELEFSEERVGGGEVWVARETLA